VAVNAIFLHGLLTNYERLKIGMQMQFGRRMMLIDVYFTSE